MFKWEQKMKRGKLGNDWVEVKKKEGMKWEKDVSPNKMASAWQYSYFKNPQLKRKQMGIEPNLVTILKFLLLFKTHCNKGQAL